MFDEILLSNWGNRNIGKSNLSILSNSLILNLLFSVIIERSKNEASEVAILFLSSRSRGYMS